MLPEYQFVYPGNFSPAAPQEMYAAIGSDGQYISVVPSENLVWIRMGENPDQLNVPILMINDIWEYINSMECETNSITHSHESSINLYPNPSQDHWNIEGNATPLSWTLYDIYGNEVHHSHRSEQKNTIDCKHLSPGVYFAEISVSTGKVIREKIIKQ